MIQHLAYSARGVFSATLTRIRGAGISSVPRVAAFLLAASILSGGVVPFTAHATISDFTIAPAGTATAGSSSTAYDVSFTTDNATATNVITISFPSGYSITNGVLGGTGSADPASAAIDGGVVHAGASSKTVVKVQGNSSARSITVTMDASYALNGDPVTFKLKKGITNPNTPGASIGAGSFLISTLPSGESLTNTNSFQIAYDYHLNVDAPTSVKAGVPFDVEVCSSDSSFSGTITLTPGTAPNKGELHTPGGALVSDPQTASASSGCATFSFVYVAASDGTASSNGITFSEASAAGQESAGSTNITTGLAENGIIGLSLASGTGTTTALVTDGVRVESPTPVDVTPGAPLTLTLIRHLPAGLGASDTNWKTTAYRFNADATKFGTTAFCIDATAQAFHRESLGNNDYRLTYVITNTPISPTGIRALQLQTYTGSSGTCGSWSSSPSGTRLAWNNAINVTENVAVDDASASDDTYSVNMNTAYTLGHTPNTLDTAASSLASVLTNDSPVSDIGPRTAVQVHDGDSLPNNINPETFSYDTGPSHAAGVDGFHLNSDGSFTYTPAPGFSGIDTFTYHVSYTRTNGQSGLTNQATVSITVNGASVKGLTLTNTTESNVTLGSDWANDHSDSGTAYGLLGITPGEPVDLDLVVSATGTPGAAWNSLGYRFATAGSGSNNGIGSSFTCVARSGNTTDNHDGTYTLHYHITNTPISPAGVRAFYLRLFSGSECGSVADGTLVSNKQAAWTGTGGPEIYYRAVDVEAVTEESPDSIGVADDFSTSINTAKTDNVLTNDHTGQVSSASAVNFTSPAHGTLSATSTAGAFTYTPTHNYAGSDSFTYVLAWTRTNGQSGTTSPITVSLHVTNGSGGGDDPIYINSCLDLQNISAPSDNTHYKLARDIDCSMTNPSSENFDGSGPWADGHGFNPIGNSSTKFNGELDGDGHLITGLYINRSTGNLGLFGYLNTAAAVKKVGVVNAAITAPNASSFTLGILVGESKGTISESFTTGTVTAGTGVGYAGGLLGFQDSEGHVSDSYSLASIVSSYDYGAGLVGYSYGHIANSYAAGSVSVAFSDKAGLAYNGGTITHSFYDQTVSAPLGANKCAGPSDITGCTGLATDAMKSLATFSNADWDITGTETEATWGINNANPGSNNNGYPFLRWQSFTPAYGSSASIYGAALVNGSTPVVLEQNDAVQSYDPLAVAPGAPLLLAIDVRVTGDINTVFNSVGYRFNSTSKPGSNNGIGTSYFCVNRSDLQDNGTADGVHSYSRTITNTPISPDGTRNFYLKLFSGTCPGVSDTLVSNNASGWTTTGGAPTIYYSAINTTTGYTSPGDPTMVAVDDSEYSVAMNGSLTGQNVIDNDTYTPGTPGLQAELVSDVSHGTLDFGAGGSFTYTPTGGFHGVDTFQYRLDWTRTNGQFGTTTPATVTISVNGFSVESVTLSRTGGTPATTTLAADGSNLHGSDDTLYDDTLAVAPGAPVTLQVVLSIKGDGSPQVQSLGYRFNRTDNLGSNNGIGKSFTYVPIDDVQDDNGYNTVVSGSDEDGNTLYTVTYTVTNTPVQPEGLRNFYLKLFPGTFEAAAGDVVNPSGSTNAQSVAWTTTGGAPTIYWRAIDTTNDANPGLLAANDGYSTPVGVELNVTNPAQGVLANDAEISGATASLVDGIDNAGSTQKGGSVTLGTDGTFAYTPPTGGWHGIDAFQYFLHFNQVNGNATTSNTATVYVVVGTQVEDNTFDFSIYNPTPDGDTHTTSVVVPQALQLTTLGSGGIAATIDIPGSTTITANGTTTWNGIINLNPVATSSVTVTPSGGHTASVRSAIEIGLGSTPISLSQPVKLTFLGAAGSLVGWTQGGGALTPITTVCNSATNPTNLSGNGDCKKDVGGDLIVWTTHLTTYGLYSEQVRSSSGGGGGGSTRYCTDTITTFCTQRPGVTSGTDLSSLLAQLRALIDEYRATGGTFDAATEAAIASIFGGATTTTSAGTSVRDLDVGMSGSDVKALQTLLIAQGYPIPAGATGFFSTQTKTALTGYQSAHGIIPAVGYFGAKTRAQMKTAGLSGLWW